MRFRPLLIFVSATVLLCLAACQPAARPDPTTAAQPAAVDLRGQGCQPVTAGGKPGAPVRACLEFLEAPRLNQPVYLRFTARSLTDADLPGSVIRLSLPAQMRVVEGPTEWSESLPAKGSLAHEVQVIIEQPGAMQLSAEVSHHDAQGYGFTVTDSLYLDAAESGVKVSQQP